MEDQSDMNKNEIINISKYEKDIIDIGDYLAEKIKDFPGAKAENLCYFFSNKDIYNEKGTKLKIKENYISLMNIINEYIKENNDFIFLYFKKIDIDIIKVIFNGYIIFDITNIEQKEFLLNTIKNVIPLFFSKDIFYFIYNKLSKIFRRFHIEDKENLFKKFCKIYDLWKLIYNIDDREKVNSNYFTLIGNEDLILENLVNEKKYEFKEVYIYIEFEEFISQMNETNKDLINVLYNNNSQTSLKYKDIINDKEEKIQNISIKVNGESINYIINEDYNNKFNQNNAEKFIEFLKLKSPSNFFKIEILKNYIGRIRRIFIKIEFKDEQISKHEYEIIPSNNQRSYTINTIEEKEGITKLYFQLEKFTKLISSKTYNDLLYEDIRYYGGMECFIPIIKIIKYFISSFKDNEDKIKKLNEILIHIIRYILKFIFYSEDNFKNLKKILRSLIGALTEINHVIQKNFKNNLYSNSVFSLLYIIIVSSSMPYSMKISYIKITELYNINKLNLNFDELIIDVNKIRINSYEWYITMLITIIELILLSYNDIKKVPKYLTNQILLIYKKIEGITNKDIEQTINRISSYVKNSILSLNQIFKTENEENNLFENYDKIKDISEYFKLNFLINRDNLKLALAMIKVYLNLLNLESFWYKLDEEKVENVELNNNVKNNNEYKNIFQTFFNNFEQFSNEMPNEIKDLIKVEFEGYVENKKYLTKLFPFLTSNNFNLESELILSELIDFHRDYHNLMKNNFIFNKFWSDKKLFFEEKKKNKYLKYKSINYYTKNYQRPFLFPVLDYKYSYPNFEEFKVKNDFYLQEENHEDYNFNLDCPEFDSFNINYEEEILKHIKNNHKMIYFDVCLVKRTHHIKGKLFVCNNNYSLMKKIIFYSYPSNISKNIPCCNSSYKRLQNDNKNKENLCFGPIFNCPEKDMNIKIIINVKDIRMVLKKIYFYRKSAVEIFTKNKSYFFNFADKSSKQSEKNCADFINMFGYFINEFFPLSIKNGENIEIIGHSRQFKSLLKGQYDEKTDYDISKEGNKFISSLFDHWCHNDNDIEFSSLDFLIYLNLLSNRSYNDLSQYPVFPILFFYDKINSNAYNIADRKLSQHIGFQDCTEKAKTRKKLIKQTYVNIMKEYDESGEDEEMDIPSYFSTHFSNNFYIAHYMIRIFPYSFISIEHQGHGFDDPNRLFFSIENTLYNISCLKSDLRELIPEFYYFPEIFLNLNKINLRKRENGIQVDDVEMPQDIFKIDKEKNKNNNNLNDEYEKSNYFRTFKLVEKMRNLLESKNTDIVSWINIIFGPRQKYNNPKDEDLYFRYESYIDYSNNKKNELKFYRTDKASMAGVEFGITPIQTVFEGDIGKRKNKNIIYNLTFKENKDLFKKICTAFIDKIKVKNNIDKENDYINSYYKVYKIIDTKKENKEKMNEEKNNQINNIFLNKELYIYYIFQNKNIKIIGYKTGKIEFFQFNENKSLELISEFFDNKDEIIHLNYNQRLNMFCSSSKDGFVNVYSLPNKLITTIKNPSKNYFDYIFLSSNPFPSIIALEIKSGNIFSYSINGFKIQSINIYNLLKINNQFKIDLYICSYFNERGGTFKDRLIFIENNKKEKENIFKCHLIRVPFFEEEDKTIDIKIK